MRKLMKVLSNLKGNIKAWSKENWNSGKETLKSVGNKDQSINQIKKTAEPISNKFGDLEQTSAMEKKIKTIIYSDVHFN